MAVKLLNEIAVEAAAAHGPNKRCSLSCMVTDRTESRFNLRPSGSFCRRCAHQPAQCVRPGH